jgi:hypothetical protein
MDFITKEPQEQVSLTDRYLLHRLRATVDHVELPTSLAVRPLAHYFIAD